MKNAKPRQSITKTITHQALCGIPNNSSLQTATNIKWIMFSVKTNYKMVEQYNARIQKGREKGEKNSRGFDMNSPQVNLGFQIDYNFPSKSHSEMKFNLLFFLVYNCY